MHTSVPLGMTYLPNRISSWVFLSSDLGRGEQILITSSTNALVLISLGSVLEVGTLVLPEINQKWFK